MKRITAFGLMTLALAATLLIGAGDWNNDRNIDPHSHENIPFAVVNKVWGNDTTIYFGELAYGKERYLMVMNSNCDDEIKSTKTETIYLAVNPGPGKYDVTGYRNLGSSSDTLSFTVEIDGSNHRLDTISFALTRGGSILLHFDPVTPDTSYSPLTLSYDSATYYVNGRKIAVDRFGRVHVCYTDKVGSTYSVWYARSDNACTTWQKQKVADNAFTPTIAVDTFGIPWISYVYKDELYLWSEGFDEEIRHFLGFLPGDVLPSIALDFEQGVGVIYYSTPLWKKMDMMAFELPSLKPLANRTTPCGDWFLGPMSCCITKEGYGIGTGEREVLLSHGLVRQRDRNLSDLHSTLKCNTYVSDFEGCFIIQAFTWPVV